MTITQHIPKFASWGVASDGTPPSTAFETLDELLNIEFVKQWQKPFCGKPFYRFSVTQDRLVVAEHDEGRLWWVVGLIDGDPSSLGLPRPRYETDPSVLSG